MKKEELLAHIGDISQIGGIKEYTFNDGKAKGVRAIEVDTGVLRFVILIDRSMDIAQAFFKGKAISWISKTGITSPVFYEKEGKGFLRGFYGGLMTTCGLKNIGSPVGEEGMHGRISNIPAQKVSVFADWISDEYCIRVSGEVRENVVFGNNLVLKRTISTKLFSNSISVDDEIVNEGFNDEKISLCYHCNFGYPLVTQGAKIVNVPDEYAQIHSPVHGKNEECIAIEYKEKSITVGVKNEKYGAYLTYERDTLPDFVLWKMLGESEYVVGLEPRTSSEGGKNMIDKNKQVILKPFESYKTKIKFVVKEIMT